MISVICSNFNGAKWLPGYLESLNQQHHDTFEVIFVDAMSSDTSIDIIDGYNFRPGIEKRVIKLEERVSIYSAWNTAIDQSTGDYIMNYNVDDRLLANALSTYDDITRRYSHVDLHYTSWLECTNEQYTDISRVHRPPIFSHNTLLQNCFIGPFPLVKRSVFDIVGYFSTDYYISGDYEMWLRMSKRGMKFKPSPCVIGYYYNNPDGVSTRNTEQRWRDHIEQDTRIRNMYR